MNAIREGDIYKVVSLHGRQFTLLYGYYEDYERGRCEPIPIYPDFKASPVYTDEGHPFVTQMQELCEHGNSKFAEGVCADCPYFKRGSDLIGICTCRKNRK